MYNIQWGINTFLEYVHINLVYAPLMYVKFMHTSYGYLYVVVGNDF